MEGTTRYARSLNVSLQENADSSFVHRLNTGLLIAVNFEETDVVLWTDVRPGSRVEQCGAKGAEWIPFRSEQQKQCPCLGRR